MAFVCPYTNREIEACCEKLSHEDSPYHTIFPEVETLGTGTSGIVTSCVVRTDEKEFAIKKVAISADALREASLWKELKHPNIVNYFMSWEELSNCNPEEVRDNIDYDATGKPKVPCLFMVIELCDTSLADKLQSENLNKRECWDIFNQIMKGLKYLHSRGILHGDLTSSNVFFKGMMVKIGDFGAAARLAEGDDVQAPRPRRLADVDDGNHVRFHWNGGDVSKPLDDITTDRYDIYCAGAILVTMLAGDRELIMLVEKKKFPVTWDKKWKSLIKKLLQKNYHRRPSANEVCEEIKSIISGLKRKRE